MARHIEFHETEALQAAMRAFWTKGYDSTSLHDLEMSMKLKRTSIYNTFGNKRELFKQVINYYQKTVLSELFALLDNIESIDEGIEKLLNCIVDIHFQKHNPGGCLAILSILEREQHDEQTIALLEKPFRSLHRFLQKRLKDAQLAGEISTQFNSAALATTIVTTITGIFVMGKAGFSKKQLTTVSHTVSQLLRL